MKHYDHTHTTVAEARECEAQRGTVITKPQPQPAKPLYIERLERQHAKATPVAKATRKHDGAAWASNPAHPNRVKFANDLINKRDTDLISFAANEVMMHVLDGKPVSRDEIALLIEDLLAAPRKDDKAASNPNAEQAEQASGGKAYAAKVKVLKAQVPDGRYAANINGSKVRFFLIKEDKGYVKIKEYASDELYPRTWGEYAGILEQVINDGVEAAGRRFGEEMGACRKCGRSLTDEDNPYKVYGYGPDCGPNVMG